MSKTIHILNNKTRVWLPIIFIGLMTLTHAIVLIRRFYLKERLGEFVTVRDIQLIQMDPVNAILSLFTILIYIFAIIYYLRWFKRAYYNIGQLGHKRKFSMGMSVGAWFIPLFHWIGPIIMMLELYRTTERKLIDENLTRKKFGRYVVITFWWTLYTLSGLISIVSIFIGRGGMQRPETTLWNFEYNNYVHVSNIVLALLALWVIWNYKRMEDKLPMLPNVNIANKIDHSSDILDDDIDRGE